MLKQEAGFSVGDIALLIAALAATASTCVTIAILGPGLSEERDAPWQDVAKGTISREAPLGAQRSMPKLVVLPGRRFDSPILKLWAETDLGENLTATAFVVAQGRSGQVLLMTAAHAIPPNCAKLGITAEEDGLQQVYKPVQLVAIDRERELALLKIDAGRDEFPRLRITPPSQITFPCRVRTAGFAGGTYTELDTAITGTSTVDFTPFVNRSGWRLKDSITGGMSGGPVVLENGYVVGIVVGRRWWWGVCISSVDMRDFLDESGFAQLEPLVL